MKKIQRTSAKTLVIVAGVGSVIGVGARPAIESLEGIAPTVGWGPGLALALGAAVLGVLARSTHVALKRDKRTMYAARGMRLLALAKASVVVGAFFAGAYGGYALAFVDAFNTPFGRDRVIHSLFAAVMAIAFTIAALFLERALQIPDDEDGAIKQAHPA